MRGLAAGMVAIAVAGLLPACGGEGDAPAGASTSMAATTAAPTVPCPDPGTVEAGANEVEATLTEYGIRLEPAEVPAGPVRFRVVNAGSEGHELLVLAEDDAAALPTDLTGGIDRTGLAPGVLVASLPAVGPGATCVLGASLRAGVHLVACSLTNAESGANHFPAGMLASLQVTG